MLVSGTARRAVDDVHHLGGNRPDTTTGRGNAGRTGLDRSLPGGWAGTLQITGVTGRSGTTPTGRGGGGLLTRGLGQFALAQDAIGGRRAVGRRGGIRSGGLGGRATTGGRRSQGLQDQVVASSHQDGLSPGLRPTL